MSGFLKYFSVLGICGSVFNYQLGYVFEADIQRHLTSFKQSFLRRGYSERPIQEQTSKVISMQGNALWNVEREHDEVTEGCFSYPR